MKTFEKITCLLAISILFIASFVIPINISASQNMNSSDKAHPSNFFIDSLLPDPRFNIEPTVEISGTSDEFSSTYHQGTDFNYIELDWTHVAGTELNFIGKDPESTMPDYNDFIYAYQEFGWPYEQKPDVVQVLLNYSTLLTGDFAPGAQEYNNIMFRVYLWAIDSSGNWILLYESKEGVYTEIYATMTVNLNYLEIADIFGGMIEKEGVQEDPDNSAKLAIGLAPTSSFQSMLGTEPWTFYNGSVSIRVSYTDIFVQMDKLQDSDSILQPEYNETYGSFHGDIFPTSPNASDAVYDDCYGMEVGPDGSVYVTGNSRSSYDLYIQEGNRFRYQFILKYDSQLHLLWKVNNDNKTQVRSMCFHEGYIYTTGYILRELEGTNLIVTKWSSKGERLWQSEWGENYSQVGAAIGVQDNGSIYVVYSDYNLDEPYYHKNGIMKFDNDGNFISNTSSIHLHAWYDTPGQLISFDDHVSFQSQYGFRFRYYFNGTFNYGGFGDIIEPDGEGGYYAASYSSPSLEDDISRIILYHIDSAGEIIWATEYSKSWPNGWYYSLTPRVMTTTPDGKIQLLVQHMTPTLEYLLLTFDFDGNLLANHTMDNENWPYYTAPFFMDSGKSGLVYFAFSFYDSSTYTTDICIQAYRIYETGLILNLTITTVIIIGSSVVIIAAVIGIVRYRKRV